MPHTSSHRRQHASNPHPSKLTYAPSEDGWSHVVRKGGISTSPTPRVSLRGTAKGGDAELAEILTLSQLEYHHKRKCGGGCGHGTGEMLPQPMKARWSEKELGERFGRVRRQWKENGMGERVRGVLGRAGIVHEDGVLEVVEDDAVAGQQEHEGRQEDADDLVDGVDKLKLDVKEEGEHKAQEANPAILNGRIEKAICLGLGSPSADTSGWRQTVLWQLAAFLETVDALRTAHPTLHAYAQDPMFNSLDTSFLSTFQIEVLPSPRAFPLITPRTLVYAPHYPVAGWPSSMRRGNAACIIGNDVGAALAGGRILGRAELNRVFGEISPPGETDTARSDADRGNEDHDRAEIPDLDAKSELEAFVVGCVTERWPEPAGMAEGAFNDTFAYWRRIEE